MKNSIFDELFVLEMANNHWGKLERGLKIVRDFGRVVRFNNMKAAIKLQLRDVDSFIHKDFVGRTDVRYIKKTLDTRLAKADYAELARAIHQNGCIPAATPFDEASVDLCVELGVKLLKIASSDINDWVLIEKIAKTKLPVIASLGGSSLKDTEDLVQFFNGRHIPLAVNHCVSLYPSEDNELEMNQIDFLQARFPNQVIGFSTHEHSDWTSSMLIAYAKGRGRSSGTSTWRWTAWPSLPIARFRARSTPGSAPSRRRRRCAARRERRSESPRRRKSRISTVSCAGFTPCATWRRAARSPRPTCTWRFLCRRGKFPVAS